MASHNLSEKGGKVKLEVVDLGMGTDSAPTRPSLDEVWEELRKALDLPETEKTHHMFLLMMELLELFSRKQHDYSSVNIALGGEEGVFTRLTDKWARLWSHYRLGRELRCESLDDTWSDLAVYAMIGALVRRGQWQLTPAELKALGASHD